MLPEQTHSYILLSTKQTAYWNKFSLQQLLQSGEIAEVMI